MWQTHTEPTTSILNRNDAKKERLTTVAVVPVGGGSLGNGSFFSLVAFRSSRDLFRSPTLSDWCEFRLESGYWCEARKTPTATTHPLSLATRCEGPTENLRTKTSATLHQTRPLIFHQFHKGYYGIFVVCHESEHIIYRTDKYL